MEALVEVAAEGPFIIGESPLWSAEEGALYWMDIKAPALHRMALDSGQRRRWALSADVGAFALLPGRDGAVVALRTGLFQLDFASGGLALLAPPPFDPARFRFNEGACDPLGGFWVGVMFDPLDPADTAVAEGPMCRFTLAGGLAVTPDRSDLHNGMAFSADGSWFFVSHSNERCIYRYRLEGAADLGERTVFARTPEALGIPDGAALDGAGGYWCALHGGGRLRRFHPDGSMDRDIMLPVSMPTMAAFAGAALDTLYVTSASEKLDRAAEPLAGALLRVRPGARGLARRTTVA